MDFVATDHPAGPVGEDDPNFRVIRAALADGAPSAVLIEMNTGGSFFKREAIRRMVGSPTCKSGGKFTCGEGAYAAGLAEARGARVLGGEGRLQDFSSRLVEKFSREDLLAFASLRAALTLQRNGAPADAWPASFRALVAGDLDLAADEGSLDFFERW